VPDHADNLQKNSRTTGLRHWMHAADQHCTDIMGRKLDVTKTKDLVRR